MEIKHALILFFTAFVLVACGGDDMITGNTIQEVPSAKELQIQTLEEQVQQLQAELAQKSDTSCRTEELLIEDLEEDLAAQIKVNKQQRQVLVELDDECNLDRETAESCEEDIESLEEKNKKLQDMLDICQEDLS